MAFDIETYFGTATVATAGTAVTFPQGVDLKADPAFGKIDDLYIILTVTGSKAVPKADQVTVDVLTKDDTTAGDSVLTIPVPKADYAVGDRIKLPLPLDLKRYLTLKVNVTGTTNGIAFTAYIEKG